MTAADDDVEPGAFPADGEDDFDDDLDDEDLDIPANTLMAELIFEEPPPPFDLDRLLGDLQEVLPGTTLADDDADGPLVAHEDFMLTYEDGDMPILTAFLRPGPEHDAVNLEDYDLSQSWTWPDDDDVLTRCKGSMAVAEMLGMAHPPEDRVQAFRTALDAAIAQLSPVAIWWPHSGQMIKPDELESDDLAGLVNVRLFQVENDPGAVVMDTLGMYVFGLPDLQCHFRDLEPAQVANLLYNVAIYLFEHGDVVDDGQTISGLEPDDRWRCQHEDSLVEPERLVLDIDPGDPYAAGERER
jgi:uncharacterized protein DUF4261